MLRSSFRLLLAGSSVLAALTAQAQQAAAPASTAEAEAAAAEEAPEIEVVGQRERGSVPGDIQPEVQLNAAAIRSYGASSVTDLLDALAPQLQSARGRDGGAPVVLLNGRRVSGFGAVRDFPTEAIERVDILPEEASLRLGYRADQRVVNIVLRRRFRSEQVELQGGGATQGDRYSASVDGTLTRIRRDKRLVVKVEYDGATPIYESDRDVVATPPSRAYAIAGNITAPTLGGEIDPRLSAIAGSTVTVAGIPESLSGTTSLANFANPANPSYFSPYRTLSSASRTLRTNASYTQTILGDITAELTGNYEAGRTVSALGLGTASLTVPTGNPFSPFAGPVVVNRYLVEAGPRLRNVDRGTAQLGMALNGDLSPEWRWSFTSNYSRTLSRTGTDTNVDTAPLAAQILAGDPTVNPFGRYTGLGDYRQDFARSLNTNAGGDMVASGPVFTLPGGKVAASLKSGYASTSLAASATRSGVVTTSNLGRDTASAQVSIDVPIASRRTAFLDALGNLSLNGNYAIDNLSDYGRLSTIGYGVNWSPIPAIRLIFSHTDDENAPSVSQLGDPTIVTPDVRTFDYVTGQSVDITRIDGGNRGLRGEERHVTKIGGTLSPFTETNLSLTANYIRSRTDNFINNLPTATAQIEAAFPDRFTRDVTGRLLRIDNRAVNFDRRDTEELRWGINFSRRLGPPPPQRGPGGPGGFGQFRRPDAAAGQPAPGTAPAPEPASGTEPPAREARTDTGTTTPPGDTGGPPQGAGPGRGFGGGGFGGSGGRGGFGGGGFGGGQLRLSVYHTWRFQDRITIRDGLPPLDLLNGFALGNGGGTARHQVQAEVNATRNGYGLRLAGQWQAATVVRGGTLSTPTDLEFSSLTTLNLRLFKNFQPTDKAARDHRWLLGTRVALDIANLTDTRLRVTDANGNVPINQQPDILNPIGRTLLFTIRKQFF